MAYEGFVVPEDIPIPDGTLFTQPLFMSIPSIGAILIPTHCQGGKGRKKKELEEIMDLSDSQDKFEVFNRPLSPESTSVDLVHHQEVGIITLDEMGIQRKSKRSLLDLIES